MRIRGTNTNTLASMLGKKPGLALAREGGVAIQARHALTPLFTTHTGSPLGRWAASQALPICEAGITLTMSPTSLLKLPMMSSTLMS